jgi:hypothetical protein
MKGWFSGWSLRLGAGIVVAATLVAAGCGKKPPEAVATGAAQGEMGGAFKDAPPDVKKMVDDALDAMAARNLARAHVLLQTLAARTNLTTQQRDVVTGCLLGVAEELRASAESGDEKAKQFQQLHQRSK